MIEPPVFRRQRSEPGWPGAIVLGGGSVTVGGGGGSGVVVAGVVAGPVVVDRAAEVLVGWPLAVVEADAPPLDPEQDVTAPRAAKARAADAKRRRVSTRTG